MRSHCLENQFSSGKAGVVVGNILLGIGISQIRDLSESRLYSSQGDIDGLRVKLLA
jgi:hypothetical protein